VTPTPNHFTISIPSWPVKALVIFFGVLLFAACEDELDGIGTKKNTSRFKVNYREFEIPVTTIQSDSISSTINDSERLLCGEANDNNFGITVAESYIQLSPLSFQSPKIDLTDKSNFKVISLSLNLLLDYYIYGDSSSATINYDLYEIEQAANYINNKQYYTTSEVSSKVSSIASATFAFDKTKFVESSKKFFDSDAANNKTDTIQFSLPIDQNEYGDLLLDTAMAKGVYWTNPNTKAWELNRSRTDSVFRRMFPGFMLRATNAAGRILGFQSTNSFMTLEYSYEKGGSTKTGFYFYAIRFPSFSKIDYNRASTSINALNSSGKYQDFNAPDDFCYLQSGSGLFAKLDFSGVRQYFDANPDTLIDVSLNGAEIFVDGEPALNRQHIQLPKGLVFRVLKQNNRFFESPIINSSYDVSLANAYYCYPGRQYLDALSDNITEGAVTLKYSKEPTTNRQTYNGWVTNFISNFLEIPKGYNDFNYMALLPADSKYGYSLHGLSFPKDKVKLRVYYTKAL
jgi:hypothetical protein